MQHEDWDRETTGFSNFLSCEASSPSCISAQVEEPVAFTALPTKMWKEELHKGIMSQQRSECEVNAKTLQKRTQQDGKEQVFKTATGKAHSWSSEYPDLIRLLLQATMQTAQLLQLDPWHTEKWFARLPNAATPNFQRLNYLLSILSY